MTNGVFDGWDEDRVLKETDQLQLARLCAIGVMRLERNAVWGLKAKVAGLWAVNVLVVGILVKLAFFS